MLINGSCSGSMIHPGLFEIIFTSLTLPPCTKAIQIADSPGNFQGIYRPGGGGGGSRIQTMLERSQISERNAEANASSRSLTSNCLESIAPERQLTKL